MNRAPVEAVFRRLRWVLGPSIVLVAAAWVLSLVLLAVATLWVLPATGRWQPFLIGAVVVGVQSSFAVTAARRVKRTHNPFGSTWTLAIFGLAVPLFIVNVYTTLALGFTISLGPV